jgi:Ion channel
MARGRQSDFGTRLRGAQEKWRDPLLTALTILLVLLMFVIAPLHAAGVVHVKAYGVGIALVLVAGVFIMSVSPIAVAAMLVAIGLLVAPALLSSAEQARLTVRFEAAAWVTIGLALIWVVSRAVFAAGQVTYHRIVGAILLYLTIGLVFVGLFTLVGLISPGSFSGLRIEDVPGLASELIYFSFVTLTSIGYGDIVPVHPVARSLCNVEGIIGQLYPATLLARLVTLGLEGRPLSPRKRRSDT